MLGAGTCSEPLPGAALGPGDAAGPLGQPFLALSDPTTPATWSRAPFAGFWGDTWSLSTPRLEGSLGYPSLAPQREGSHQTWGGTGHRTRGGYNSGERVGVA